MYIRELTDSDKDTYNNLAENYGTIFNTLKWLELFKDKIKIFGIFDKGKNLIGGFHLYNQKKLFVNFYSNPPFTPFIGPFFKKRTSTDFANMTFQKKVLKCIAEFLNKLNSTIQFFSLDRDIMDVQPFIWRKFIVSIRYTYKINLNQEEDRIWKNFSPERRNDIRKANKDEIKIIKNSEKKIIMNLVRKSLKRHNKTLNIRNFRKILFNFASENNCFSFVAYNKEKPVSVSFCIHDKKTAYYVIGGYDYEYKHHGAGASTIWECIKYARKLGLKEFDFDGSMIPNIERYFRGFGGQLTPYFRINKSNYIIRVIQSLLNKENI